MQQKRKENPLETNWSFKIFYWILFFFFLTKLSLIFAPSRLRQSILCHNEATVDILAILIIQQGHNSNE